MEIKKELANDMVRKEMKVANVSMWRVAECIGVCENTLSRWMRKELPEWKRNMILSAIWELQAEDNGDKTAKEGFKKLRKNRIFTFGHC